MAIKLITERPQKAQFRRIQYPGSPHILNGWELPPNIPGFQWIIHTPSDTRLTILRDAAIQIMFLLTTWRTLDTLIPKDTLVGWALALGLLLICQAAIHTKFLIIRGPSEDHWFYVETEIWEEEDRRDGHQHRYQHGRSPV